MINAPIEGFPNRQFQVLRRIGSGSQGQVFLVQSINWGENDQKKIALKYQCNVSQNELDVTNSIMNYQKQKENSGQQSQQLESQQIIKIYDVFQHMGQIFIIMEAGEQDLFCYLSSEKISYDQKIRIMKQLSQALYFFHKTLNLLHRDIKPENFLKVGDEFKLIDFGLAKQAQKRFMTMNVGTPLFQAPEQIQGQSNYTQAVDIWSLACLFYEVLKAQPLFAGENEQQTKQLILDSSQNYLKNKLKNLEESQQLKDLLSQMLSYDPKDRLNIENVVIKLNLIQNQQNSNCDLKQNFIFKSDGVKQQQPVIFQQKFLTPQPPNSNAFNLQFQQNPQVLQQPIHQKNNEQKQLDQISLMQQQIMDYLKSQNFEEQFQNQNNQYQKLQQYVYQTFNKYEQCFNDLKDQLKNQQCEEKKCLNGVSYEQQQQINFERLEERIEHLIQEQQNIFKSQNDQNQFFQSEMKENNEIKENLNQLHDSIFKLQQENEQLKKDIFQEINKYKSQQSIKDELMKNQSEQKNNQQELYNKQQRNFERLEERIEHLIQEQQNISFKSQNQQNQIFQSEMKENNEIKENLNKLHDSIFKLQQGNEQLKNDIFQKINKYKSQENFQIELKTRESLSESELRLSIQNIEDQIKQQSNQIKMMHDNSQIYQSQIDQINQQAQQLKHQNEEQNQLIINLKKLTEKICNPEQEKSSMSQEYKLQKQIDGLYLEIMLQQQKINYWKNSLSFKRENILDVLNQNIKDLQTQEAENPQKQQLYRENVKKFTSQLTDNLNQDIQETIKYIVGAKKEIADIRKIKNDVVWGLIERLNYMDLQKI